MIEFQPIETTGIQSRVEVGRIEDSKIIRKTSGWEYDEPTKLALFLAMDDYRRQLVSLGISVPLNYEMTLTKHGIETVDEFVTGNDVDHELKEGRGLDSWRQIVSVLCELSESGLMIDAKPANWIKNGELYFIDLYPPPLRDENGNISPFIPELYKRDIKHFNFTYGDIRGQITKLLAGARFTYPELLPELEQITRDVISNSLTSDKADYITGQINAGYPDMDAIYSGDLDRLGELLNG